MDSVKELCSSFDYWRTTVSPEEKKISPKPEKRERRGRGKKGRKQRTRKGGRERGEEGLLAASESAQTQQDFVSPPFCYSSSASSFALHPFFFYGGREERRRTRQPSSLVSVEQHRQEMRRVRP